MVLRRHDHEDIGGRDASLEFVRTKLMMSGRDNTLVGATDSQVAAVGAALSDRAEFADVPVTAALCFIDSVLALRDHLDQRNMGTQARRAAKLAGRA